MQVIRHSSYRGPLQAVIFDWAGTTVDYGCMAPAAAFTTLFERHGVQVTVPQAREPMGMHKREHIRAMLAMPEVRAGWEAAQGHSPSTQDIEDLFAEFVPLQLTVLEKHTDLIPGVLEAVSDIRQRGMKIGATTGYNPEMMGVCMAAAKTAGYEPDTSVAVTEVPFGRPEPWMAVKVAMSLRVFPWESLVKVGDTVTDIQEGLNAGMWSVGVVKTGNELGKPLAEIEALPEAELRGLLKAAAERLYAAGAHFVIDGAGDLPPVLDEITELVAAGDRP